MGLGNRKLFVGAEKYHICHVFLYSKLSRGLTSVSYLDDFNHIYKMTLLYRYPSGKPKDNQN